MPHVLVGERQGRIKELMKPVSIGAHARIIKTLLMIKDIVAHFRLTTKEEMQLENIGNAAVLEFKFPVPSLPGVFRIIACTIKTENNLL